MYKVCIVDDDPSTCRALRRLLDAAGYQTTTHQSATEYLAAPATATPDCLLLDIHMPELDGLSLQTKLNETGDAPPIVFLTGRGDVPMSVQAMRAGAADFLLKPVDEDDLFAAIQRAVTERKKDLPPSNADEEKLRAHLALLTPREDEVLDVMLTGALNKEIAAKLGIAERTVKMHRARLMRKLDAKTLLDLAPYIPLKQN
ncbi:response regulator transcription factor [Roseibium alexandrii]|uniref:Transcriptional regulatory protein TdiR n=1 Tax=Roseibium alexandrii TaxID=388408 RepID=A0A0M7AST8_9HYPH|nr:response regulator [Roseibium alexandrii]CTQ77522.1 Transcriptional regulatory protein TdiR [Roseibium alexandrii]